MDVYTNPTVRGEAVTILGQHSEEEKAPGVLGASDADNTILVRYPDGEQGYVSERDIQEAA